MRFPFRTAALVLCALALAACSSKGKVREPAKLGDIDSRVSTHMLWDESPGVGNRRLFTGLTLMAADDALFAADVDGEVFALNPDTGATIWENDTGTRVAAGPGIAFDQVLVGTLDGDVLALKRKNGALIWRAKVSSEVLAQPVSNGKIVVVRCVDGHIWGLNADTGERLWTVDRTVPPLTLRGLSAPLLIGDLAVTGLDNGHLLAVKTATGDVAWEQVVSAPTGRSELDRITDIDADLIADPDLNLIFVASFGGELAALGMDDGQSHWRRSVKSYTGFVRVGKALIVTDENGVVLAYDAETGAQLWKQEGLLNRSLSRPAELDGNVVVTDRLGYLHWIDPADGKLIGRLQLDIARRGNPRNEARLGKAKPGFGPPPVVRNGRLYVETSTGRIAAIQAKPRT